MKYYKRSAVIEAINFEEIVQHEKDSGRITVNGIPGSFTYRRHRITHENDDCYLIASPTGGSLPFRRGDMLTFRGDGSLFPMELAYFCMTYAALPEAITAPPPEQECEHRKISFCHGSSLWVCADCDERFNADEFSRLLLEPPEEGMTIAGDGASELGKLMREQRKGGPVPHA